MSYNPHIAAARREAKRHARETGDSYQASLEMVARAAGAVSWSDYMANPVDILDAHRVDHGIARSNIQPAVANPKRWTGRCMRIAVGMAATLSIAAAGSAATLLADARYSASMTSQQQDDSNAAAHVTFKGDVRPAFVKMLPGNRRDVVFIMGDFRGLFDTSWWRTWYRALVWTGSIQPRGAGVADDAIRAFLVKSEDHQVHRVRLVVDCPTGRYRMTRIELADSYRGEAAASMTAAPHKPWRQLPADESVSMCSYDALARSGFLSTGL